jgi:hypothetical protein
MCCVAGKAIHLAFKHDKGVENRNRGGGGGFGGGRGQTGGEGWGATEIGGAGGRGELSKKEREGKQGRIIPRLFILFAPRIGKRKEFA